MKKFLIFSVAVALTASASAQESLLFGMRGNPNTLKMNPGAEVRTALWLGLPTVATNVQFTRPLSQYFGDVNANFTGFTTPSEQITTQIDVDILSAGMKLGRNILIFGSVKNQLDVRFALDNDLARFALNGMRDLNGNIDPNYQGDFSDLAFNVSDRLTASAGLQIKLNKKLRVGAAYNRTYVVADGGMRFDKLHFNSSALANGLNELSIAAQGNVAYYGILDRSMGQNLDELQQYLDNLNADDYTALAQLMPSYSSIDLGATLRPTKKFRVTGSVLGLGAGASASRGFQIAINNAITTSGFQWNAADTGVDPLDSFIKQVQDSLAFNLDLTSPNEQTFKPFQAIHLAGYWDLAKWHSVGVRYSQVARPSLSYTAIAAEYHANLMKGWQISGAYTRFLSGSQPMSDQFSVALQMRILPPLQLYVASSAFGMMPSFDAATQTPLIPTTLDRVNFSVGLNLVFFERKPKSDRKANKPVVPAEPKKK